MLAQAKKSMPYFNRVILALGASLLAALGITDALAQAPPPVPLIISPPIVDTIDENHVSILSGKSQFTIPALKLGDVSFVPFSYGGPHFTLGHVTDQNYGYIIPCATTMTSGTTECANADLQVVYGQERATFTRQTNGIYTPNAMDGGKFVDGGTVCTWTRHDGTQVVFIAFHQSNDVRCLSNNVSQTISPEGRIATYTYYGAFSTTYGNFSPILSIATNSGYLLKYNYSGTPTWGGETSVTAINRAFVACDPSLNPCTVTGTWPTATLSWQTVVVPSDDLLSAPDPTHHYIFTIEDETHKRHVFGLDSIYRVISYQPPEATAPVYTYNLCSLHRDAHTLTNCFGYTYWYYDGVHPFEPARFMIDLVDSAMRNGQTWKYGASFTPASAPPGWSTWGHGVLNPQGHTMGAAGNATPGTESSYGPTEYIKHYDGPQDNFERNTRNYLATRQLPSGILKSYGYDFRGNPTVIRVTPIGSGLSPTVQSADYPEHCSTFLSCTCTNIYTCNKPVSITDANQNAADSTQHTADFTYEPAHGGISTATGHALAGNQTLTGKHPQTRYTYAQRYAWYLNSAGVMTRETRPIWVKMTESYCRSSDPASPGPGCSAANDEVVTSFDYGADSGPNNLLLRGTTVGSGGQTLRTCYGHDPRGDTIWEASPNANRSGCPDF